MALAAGSSEPAAFGPGDPVVVTLMRDGVEPVRFLSCR